MAAYVCMLRGVNIGATNRISMPALQACVERLGFTDVVTYVQSGNVVFAGARRKPDAVGEAVSSALAQDEGLNVAVLVRTAEDMQKVVDANPFVRRGDDPAKLHVTFLSAPGKRTDAPPGIADELSVHGREVYLHCPDGYGRTKLNNAFFERKLGGSATTRNWKTVTALRDLAHERSHGRTGRKATR